MLLVLFYYEYIWCKKIKSIRSKTFSPRSKRFKNRPKMVQARILKKLRNGNMNTRRFLENQVNPKLMRLNSLMDIITIYKKTPFSEKTQAIIEAKRIIYDLEPLIENELQRIKKAEKLGSLILDPFRPTSMGKYKLTKLERDYHMNYKDLFAISIQLNKFKSTLQGQKSY